MSYGRTGRSEMQRGDQQTLTLDDTALASNPGGLRVSLWRWSQRYPKWPVILVGSVILTPILMLLVSSMFMVAIPLVVVSTHWYMKRVREHFLYGDANPGMVISSSPLLIAVRTDMSKGEGYYPVLHVREEKPSPHFGEPAEVGKRLATIALYGTGPEEDKLRWAEFNPRPVEPVAADAEEARRLRESFPPQQWAELESAIEQIRPRTEGLFEIEV